MMEFVIYTAHYYLGNQIHTVHISLSSKYNGHETGDRHNTKKQTKQEDNTKLNKHCN
jgi:hypothetical protein